MPSSTFTGTLFLTYNRNSHEWQCSRRSYTISIRSQCDADQKRRLRRCDFSRWSQGFRVTQKVSSNSIHTLPSADADKKPLMITRLSIEICIRSLVGTSQRWYVPTDLQMQNNNDGQVIPARRCVLFSSELRFTDSTTIHRLKIPCEIQIGRTVGGYLRLRQPLHLLLADGTFAGRAVRNRPYSGSHPLAFVLLHPNIHGLRIYPNRPIFCGCHGRKAGIKGW